MLGRRLHELRELRELFRFRISLNASADREVVVSVVVNVRVVAVVVAAAVFVVAIVVVVFSVVVVFTVVAAAAILVFFTTLCSLRIRSRVCVVTTTATQIRTGMVVSVDTSFLSLFVTGRSI